jgi:hypothetical protein
MRRYRLRELLRAGQPSMGTHFDWLKNEGRTLRDLLGGG